MTLTLTVQSGEGASPRAIEIEGEGGTIGRAPDCTMVLANGQRAISRIHARIGRREDAYVLVDAGSKVRTHGDFVERGLSAGFVAQWDAWPQRGLVAARDAMPTPG